MLSPRQALKALKASGATSKGAELANRCPDTIDEAMQAAYNGLDRVASDTDLCFALLRQTGLFFGQNITELWRSSLIDAG